MSSEWQATTLGRICEAQGGAIQTGPFGSQLHTSDYKESGIPVVMPTNIGDGGIVEDGIARIDQADVDRLSQHKLLLGDIVFSRRGDVTKNALIRDREVGWFCGTGCLKVRLGEEKIAIAKFISHCLRQPEIKEWLVRHAVGATMPNLNTGILSAVPIYLPPLRIQFEIADMLDSLDNRITLLRETNTTLEAIAQALFKSWFVDFDPVRAKQECRAPEGMDEATAALFPDSFEESELGLVPRAWRVGELGDLLSLRNERTKPTARTATLPYVPIESISAKVPFLQEHKSGNEANSSLILFREGDVLFGAMRPYFHKVCAAPFDGVTRTTVFTLVSKNPGTNAFALFQAYQDTTIQYATQHSEGSTIPYAKWNNSLERMPIILPPESVQVAFSNIVSSFIGRANGNILQAQTLATLRDTLLPRLISGQLRLPEAEALAA